MRESAGKTIVLVVEDEMLVRMLGMDILEDAGFEVLEAGNADEAMTILAKHDDIRVLFSDVDMPGSMNGLGLAQLVHERWPSIRLLLTSGNHQLHEVKLPDSGKFVSKPWTQDVLVHKIRDVLA